MKIEKELKSMDHHFFKRIEYYLACIKEIQLKLSESRKGFPKKDRQLIELVLMNLGTPYDVLCSLFHTNWWSHKEDRVSTIHLMSFVIYLLGININCFMKGILVVNNMLSCSREMVSISTRIEDVLMVISTNSKISTKKLNWE